MTDVRDTLLLSGFPESMRLPPLRGEMGARNRTVSARLDSWTTRKPDRSRVAVSKVTFGDQPGSGSQPSAGSPLGGGAVARAIDVAIAFALVVCLLPVLAGVALLVFVTDPGPVLFSHTRKGKGGQSFKCLKFRSMVLDADLKLHELLARDPAARAEWDRDHKLRIDPRITRIGAFLRRSSLDELPQLFNVLRGDMSLVGPRPIVEAEVARYGRYIHYYYRVRPGVTGLWQVSGRNNTTYRRRVALDVMYTRRKSTGLNFKIMMMTLPSVFASKGAF